MKRNEPAMSLFLYVFPLSKVKRSSCQRHREENKMSAYTISSSIQSKNFFYFLFPRTLAGSAPHHSMYILVVKNIIWFVGRHRNRLQHHVAALLLLDFIMFRHYSSLAGAACSFSLLEAGE